jgi:RNA polymerase sigma factor (sigma-70 family)
MTPHEREEKILKYHRIALRAATAFWARTARHFDIEDVKSEGTLALVRAVDQWNPAKSPGEGVGFDSRRAGDAFSAFLVQRINWELIRWLHHQTGGVQYNSLVKQGVIDRAIFVGITVRGKGPDDEPTMPMLLFDSEPNPEQRMLSPGARIREAIAATRLKEKDRAVIEMAIQGFHLTKMAIMMNVSPEMCRQRRQRAIKLIRETVAEHPRV